MGNPVVHVERCPDIKSVHCLGSVKRTDSPDSVKITIVEDQKELVLVIQSLNSMGGPLGEVPDITDVEGVDLVLTVLVYSRDDDPPSVHKSPFSLNESASCVTNSGKSLPFSPHDANAARESLPSSSAAARRRCRDWPVGP